MPQMTAVQIRSPGGPFEVDQARDPSTWAEPDPHQSASLWNLS